MQTKYRDGAWIVVATKPEIAKLKAAADVLTPLVELPTEAKGDATAAKVGLLTLIEFLETGEMPAL